MNFKKILIGVLLFLMLFNTTITFPLAKYREFKNMALAAPAQSPTQNTMCGEHVFRFMQSGEITTFWGMVMGGIDALIALIPAVFVWVLKLLIFAFGELLMNLMAPKVGSTLYGFTRTSAGSDSIVIPMWEVCRSLANVAILLALVYIAINIILQKKEYLNYMALLYLLVIALIVNFTLVICGAFIDLSNYLTVLFMSNMQNSTIGCIMATVIYKIQGVFVNQSTTGMIFKITLSNIIALAVAFIFFGQLLTIILYVIVRVVTLWFLVALSPLAAVAYALPATKQWYDKWVSNFRANLINFPILAVSIYFILNIMIIVANAFIKMDKPESPLAMALGMSIIMIVLAQMLVSATAKLNVKGIDGATKWLNTNAKKGLNAAKKSATSFAERRMLASKTGQKISETLKSNRFATVAKIGNTMESRLQNEQKATTDQIDYWKKSGNIGYLERVVKMNSGPTGDKASMIAALSALSDLDRQGKYNPASGKKLTEDNKILNRANEVLDVDGYGGTDMGKALRDSLIPTTSIPAAEAGTYTDLTNFDKTIMPQIRDRFNDREKAKNTNWTSFFTKMGEYSFDPSNTHSLSNLLRKIQLSVPSATLKTMLFNKGSEKELGKNFRTIAALAIVADSIEKGTAIGKPPAPFIPRSGTEISAKIAEISNDGDYLRDNALDALNRIMPNGWGFIPSPRDTKCVANAWKARKFVKP